MRLPCRICPAPRPARSALAVSTFPRLRLCVCHVASVQFCVRTCVVAVSTFPRLRLRVCHVASVRLCVRTCVVAALEICVYSTLSFSFAHGLVSSRRQSLASTSRPTPDTRAGGHCRCRSLSLSVAGLLTSGMLLMRISGRLLALSVAGQGAYSGMSAPDYTENSVSGVLAAQSAPESVKSIETGVLEGGFTPDV